MKQGFVLYNGDFFPSEEVLFSGNIFNQFIFSEKIRAVKTHLPFWEEHLRLWEFKFKLFGLPIPKFLNELKRQIERTLTKNKLFQNAEISLTFLNQPECIGYLIAAKEFSIPNFNTNGINIDLFDKVPKAISPLSSIKEGSEPYWKIIHGQQDLKYEFLVTNTSNCILESPGKNIFIIKGTEIFTPSPSTGAYVDISKKLVRQISEKIGLKFSEVEMLDEKELLEADEIFLCSSLHGVQWVKGFKNKRYFCKTVRQINEEFNSALLV